MGMGIDPWLELALLSALCFGLQAFLHQELARRGADERVVQVIAAAIVCIGALYAVNWNHLTWSANSHWVFSIGIAQGAFYFFTTLYRLDALRRRIPVGVLYPIVKMSTLVVVIVCAFFPDKWDSWLRSETRIIGVGLSLAVTWLLVGLPERRTWIRLGIFSALGAMLASAGASLMAKVVLIAVTDVDFFVFMLVSNLVSLLLATGRACARGRALPWENYQAGLVGGLLVGFLNFVGLSSFMRALQTGELSAVASANALYILIPVLLDSWLHRTHLPLKKHAAVALTIVAAAFLSA
jgi:uncharacterized membrane protein